MEELKKFLGKYCGAIIGIIVAIVILATRLYDVIIGIVVIFLRNKYRRTNRIIYRKQ